MKRLYIPLLIQEEFYERQSYLLEKGTLYTKGALLGVEGLKERSGNF